jgi:hypothetical protein
MDISMNDAIQTTEHGRDGRVQKERSGLAQIRVERPSRNTIAFRRERRPEHGLPVVAGGSG